MRLEDPLLHVKLRANSAGGFLLSLYHPLLEGVAEDVAEQRR